MRLSPAAVLAALSLVVVAPSGVPQQPPRARVQAPEPRPFGSECRIGVAGSRVVADCHNPYPETDRVRLHVECDRWWDIDLDSAPVEAGPAQSVRLTGRCWKEVRAVWVSHQK
ncbi:hypothetical protein [Streptomyces kanamyceticus]|uniref:Secreted protein n=1 Tax=Streptomyces kanamyceticus TaxID=1967 RepID=A0A5J6GLI7_STRKN|nr:hypothetical protein [Streptomyces kanamyceticus]QEU95274.1 hypothetical protein CP970_34070 [Streptomyces kanamyceticus]